MDNQTLTTSSSSSSSCPVFSHRSIHHIPLPSDVEPHDKACFWDAARRYKDLGFHRGTIWRLLYAEPRYKAVILANNLNALDVANKLKKESYAKGVSSLLDNDAQRFIQAGILMRDTTGGFFQ